MGARKHNPGTSPRRGVPASVVVGVRLTPEEAARLDALGPNRGETLRQLVEAATLMRASAIADRGALEAHRIAAEHPSDPVEKARRLAESIIGTAERVRDTIAGLGDPAPHRHTGAAD